MKLIEEFNYVLLQNENEEKKLCLLQAENVNKCHFPYFSEFVIKILLILLLL